MTLQHAKAIKIVLSLRCQKEIKYEKMNVHAVMLREINFGVMFKLIIFGFTCFATCSHLIMSIYHWTNSSFSMCKKKNIQKEKDEMNWRVFTAQYMLAVQYSYWGWWRGCEVLGENQSCVGIKKLRGILNMSCGERVKINKGPFIFVTTGDKTYGSMI